MAFIAHTIRLGNGNGPLSTTKSDIVDLCSYTSNNECAAVCREENKYILNHLAKPTCTHTCLYSE